MFGFLFRKTIFDGWDHILGLFLANIGYLLLLALGFQFWSLCSKGVLPLHVTALLLVLVILLFSLYSMGIARYASNIAGGARRGQGLEGVPETVRTHVPHAMLFAFITLVIVVNLLFAMPFYMSMGGFAGPLMAFVGLFLSIFLMANFKFYLPLCQIRPEEGVVEIVKYSFAYALDNRRVTFLLLLRSALDLLVSVPFVGIIPGFAGMLLSDTLAAEILNRRYVLAEERDVEKTAVPWDEVLDGLGKKRYDKRRFISLLFPGR